MTHTKTLSMLLSYNTASVKLDTRREGREGGRGVGERDSDSHQDIVYAALLQYCICQAGHKEGGERGREGGWGEGQ